MQPERIPVSILAYCIVVFLRAIREWIGNTLDCHVVLVNI